MSLGLYRYNYHSTVVQFQFKTPSILSKRKTIRKNLSIIAQNLSKCINDEHGLSGHLESDIKITNVKASGTNTIYDLTNLSPSI